MSDLHITKDITRIIVNGSLEGSLLIDFINFEQNSLLRENYIESASKGEYFFKESSKIEGLLEEMLAYIKNFKMVEVGDIVKVRDYKGIPHTALRAEVLSIESPVQCRVRLFDDTNPNFRTDVAFIHKLVKE